MIGVGMQQGNTWRRLCRQEDDIVGALASLLLLASLVLRRFALFGAMLAEWSSRGRPAPGSGKDDGTAWQG